MADYEEQTPATTWRVVVLGVLLLLALVAALSTEGRMRMMGSAGAGPAIAPALLAKIEGKLLNAYKTYKLKPPPTSPYLPLPLPVRT